MPPSGSRAERTSSTRWVEKSLSRVGCVVVEQRRHAVGHEVFRIAGPIGAAAGVEAHDLVEADPVMQHRRRQIEEIGELPVPGRQLEIRVKDRDALARVVERMLQLVAARLDRRRGFVDQFQRRLPGDGAGPQEQRQHLARGRGADGGRQQEFRVADQLRARLLRRVVVEAALAQESGKRAARPGRSQIAGDCDLEFAGRRRRSPQPERLWLSARACERARLGAFERARLAGQRKGDEGGDIGPKRQNDAADERARSKGHKRGGAQPGDRERPMRQKGLERLVRLNRGEQQQIDPGERARRHARDGAARRAATPEESAEEGRRDLRDRGERQKPDRGETGLAGDARIGESERENARRSRHGEPTAPARRCRRSPRAPAPPAAATEAASRDCSRW